MNAVARAGSQPYHERRLIRTNVSSGDPPILNHIWLTARKLCITFLKHAGNNPAIALLIDDTASTVVSLLQTLAVRPHTTTFRIPDRD
jgi:hypothetical protein